MAMKTITATYKDEKEDDYINLYENQLETNVKFYNDYVKECVKLIKDYNLEYPANYFKDQLQVEEKETRKNHYGMIRSSDTGYVVEQRVTCNIHLSPLFEESKVCKGEASVVLCTKSLGRPKYFECEDKRVRSARSRYYGKNSYRPYEVKSDPAYNPSALASSVCEEKLEKKFEAFKSSYSTAVNTYWEKEVGKVFSCALKLIDSKNLAEAKQNGKWEC